MGKSIGKEVARFAERKENSVDVTRLLSMNNLEKKI